jgi:hypothetical protein
VSISFVRASDGLSYSGQRIPVGESVVIKATSTTRGYPLILDRAADGTLNVLVPGPTSDRPEEFIEAGTTVQFPDGLYEIQTVPPLGRGALIAIVAPNQFSLERMAPCALTDYDPSHPKYGTCPPGSSVEQLERLNAQLEKAIHELAAGPSLEGWAYGSVVYEIIA